MRKSLVPPPVLLEQFNLRSGPIERPGFERYGVVFSTHKGATENDIDTAAILGKTLVNTALKGPDGEFTVLGGYFAKRVKDDKGNNAVEISKVFGDALDASKGFGLSGGNEMIGDNWEQMANAPTEIRKKYVDERNFGESGWTFLTNFKAKRSFFPHSSNEIHIVEDCPEIRFSHYTFSYPDDKLINASFHLRVEGEGIEEFTWNMGDGSDPIKTKKPEVKHTYERPFGDDVRFTVSVTSSGPGPCGDSESIGIKIPGREHPALKSVAETKREKSQDKKETTIDFVATLEKADNPHLTYTWDFGDGSDKVVKKGPDGLKATHTYKNGDDFLTHQVSVDGKGPETCESSVITSVRLDPSPVDCPVIGEIKQTDKRELSDSHVQFTIKAAFTGASPRQFIWSWEDEGREQIKVTDVPELTLVLKREQEDNRPVIIALDTVGPGTCKGESDICVHVPGLVADTCPWYMKAFPYVLALLFTMLIGAVITCYVGVNMGQAIEGAPTDHMYTWTIVLAFATMILGFIWAVLGKKSACGPRICNILLILATGLIGSSIFSALIGECFESYLPLFFIMLFLGIITAIYYQRRCKDKHTITQIAIFIAMGVLAVILAVSMHANPVLQCLQ